MRVAVGVLSRWSGMRKLKCMTNKKKIVSDNNGEVS